jgi:hypothetical protein
MGSELAEIATTEDDALSLIDDFLRARGLTRAADALKSELGNFPGNTTRCARCLQHDTLRCTMLCCIHLEICPPQRTRVAQRCAPFLRRLVVSGVLGRTLQAKTREMGRLILEPRG